MKARIDEIMVPMIREGIVDVAETVAIHAAILEFQPDATQLAKYGQWLQEGLESLKSGYVEPTAKDLQDLAVEAGLLSERIAQEP